MQFVLKPVTLFFVYLKNHLDRNTAKMIWDVIRDHVAIRNISFSMNKVKNLVDDTFKGNTQQE